MYEYVITCGPGVMLVHAIVDKDTMALIVKLVERKAIGNAELGPYLAYHPTTTEPQRYH